MDLLHGPIIVGHELGRRWRRRRSGMLPSMGLPRVGYDSNGTTATAFGEFFVDFGS